MNVLILSLLIISFGRLQVVEGIGDMMLFGPDAYALAGSNYADYESPYSFLRNPASLPLSPGIQFVIGGGLVNHDEKRSILAYDPFNNTVGEEIIYSASNNYTPPLLFGISYSNGFLGASVSRAPLYDLNYRYSKVERLDAYTVKEKEEFTYSGGIEETSFNLSLKTWEFLSIGMSVDYLKGKKKYRHYLYSPPEELIEGDTVDFSGLSFRIGGIVPLDYRASISMIFSSGATLKGDTEWKIPKSLTFSLMLRPPSRIETKVYFTYRFINFSSVKDELKNVSNFAIGFEHFILPRNSIMIGAALRNSSVRNDLYLPSFSAGMRGIMGKISVTVGVLYEPVEYTLYVANIRNKVRESKTKLFAGFEGKF